jgi:MFS family permease
MAKGLHLIGERYSLIVLIFFIPYVLFQPPATVVLRKVGPRMFLSAITLLWGCCMIVCTPCDLFVLLDLTASTGIRLRQSLGSNARSSCHSRCS